MLLTGFVCIMLIMASTNEKKIQTEKASPFLTLGSIVTMDFEGTDDNFLIATMKLKDVDVQYKVKLLPNQKGRYEITDMLTNQYLGDVQELCKCDVCGFSWAENPNNPDNQGSCCRDCTECGAQMSSAYCLGCENGSDGYCWFIIV